MQCREFTWQQGIYLNCCWTNPGDMGTTLYPTPLNKAFTSTAGEPNPGDMGTTLCPTPLNKAFSSTAGEPNPGDMGTPLYPTSLNENSPDNKVSPLPVKQTRVLWGTPLYPTPFKWKFTRQQGIFLNRVNQTWVIWAHSSTLQYLNAREAEIQPSGGYSFQSLNFRITIQSLMSRHQNFCQFSKNPSPSLILVSLTLKNYHFLSDSLYFIWENFIDKPRFFIILTSSIMNQNYSQNLTN